VLQPTNYVCGTELICNTTFLSFFPTDYIKAVHHTFGVRIMTTVIADRLLHRLLLVSILFIHQAKDEKDVYDYNFIKVTNKELLIKLGTLMHWNAIKRDVYSTCLYRILFKNSFLLHLTRDYCKILTSSPRWRNALPLFTFEPAIVVNYKVLTQRAW